MSATKCLNRLVCSIHMDMCFELLLFLSCVIARVLTIDMRKDVQEIFKFTPHDKQVMMFSATLSKEIRPVCKRFMQDVIFVATL